MKSGSCPTAPLALFSDEAGYVYEVNPVGSICATISGFNLATGLSVDRNGNVYVANASGTPHGNSSIVVFNVATGKVVKVLIDRLSQPTDVAVDLKGDIAVANSEVGDNGPGDILLYAGGSTTPTGQWTSSNGLRPEFCAFDKQGNLDIEGPGAVGVIFASQIDQDSPTVHLLSGVSPENPGGVQVADTTGPYGTLVILNSQNAELYTYNALSYPNLGTPTVAPLPGAIEPIGFAFAGSKHVVVADDSTPFGDGVAELYTYPGGSLVIQTTFGSFLFGAGEYPSEQF